ncbi:oxidoreductase [Candidatus Berkiella aquae]|uniref:NADH:flavin oxidoreductase/NADH oxidase n=1 Tax=Candidatus Berkiella aquae TaxID=295108 RepID=A0A0Q9Z0F8_9GAMM|nr:NADH:flavin oxidoreductase/NADH oxidase [Candidatus Berkiella aquae]MCS5711867.1 NADH:flavin oxidoreductase/NADH oxidase [Candidatus Berkiella aquae]
MDDSHLFSHFQLREIRFKNRIAVSPMCQYSSIDGFATDWHLVHLGSRAVGGAALVFTEAAAVMPQGRITPYDLGIWSDNHIDYLARIADFIHAQGAIAGIQLAHAGRKASTSRPWEGGSKVEKDNGGWQVVAPSALAFAADSLVPTELNLGQIQAVVAAFAMAAKRALEANFKVIEIHSAHGYLLHEFLSPLSNIRKDNYGGSFENRIRLLLEVVQGVRQVWPDEYPLFVRISATDWTEKGWALNDSVMLSERLKAYGVDFIDCSSGGNVAHANIPVGPGYQTPFAERIRDECHIATGAVGLIVSPAQADHIIRTQQADMVLLAREMLRDPYFPLRAARELRQDITWPSQYLRANPLKNR